MPTVGYQAGTEANAVEYSFALEATYGVKPAVQFQVLRATSDTMSGKKDRSRPAELNSSGEVSAAVTQKEHADGDIAFALSFGTYDALFAASLGNAQPVAVALAGAAGDITMTTGTNVLSSTTANKFAGLSQGQWIRVLGFSNTVNNGIFQIVTKTNATALVLSNAYAPGVGGAVIPRVTETPALAAAQIRGNMLRNGSIDQTLWIQKKLASALFLQYPGSYPSKFTIAGGVAAFLTGTVSFLSAVEQQVTVNGSTGSVLPAPTGNVHNAVGGFGGVFLNGAPIAAVVDSFTLSFASIGAAVEYGMGSSTAAGFLAGLLEVTGTLKLYFRDFSLYQLFKAETGGTLSFVSADNAGNAYVFSVNNASLMNPMIVAGGQNQAVMATFVIEGNPSATTAAQIDALVAT